MADDVLDQPHRFLEQRRPVLVGEFVPRLPAFLLVLDVAQVELLIPVPRREVVVGQDSLIRVPVHPEGQEDVVERLAEAVVEGVLRHDRVEDRRQRLRPVPDDGGEFGGGGKAAGERQCDAAEQPAVVHHHDAGEERGGRRVREAARCRRRDRGVDPADERREDAVLRVVGGENVFAAVVEAADDLPEQAGLILLPDPSHAGEGVAVVSHGRVPGGPVAPAGVAEDERALFGIAAGLVARQALSDGDRVPDLFPEVVVHGAAAAGVHRGRLLVGTNASGEHDPGRENEGERARDRRHGGTRGAGGGVHE